MMISSLFMIVPLSDVVSATYIYSSYLYKFDSNVVVKPEIVRINNDMEIIAYTGLGNDGYIKTVGISANGTIQSTIDTWNFETVEAYYCHVAVKSNVGVISYIDQNGYEKIKSFYITSSGIISKSFISYTEYIFSTDCK